MKIIQGQGVGRELITTVEREVVSNKWDSPTGQSSRAVQIEDWRPNKCLYRSLGFKKIVRFSATMGSIESICSGF